MYTFILQDWITIRAGGTGTITQSESGWLDLTPYQDVVFWLDVREQSGTATPTIAYETSPTKDDGFFTGVIAAQTMSVGVAAPQKGLLSGATVPIARYLRWKVSGTGAWDVTFRVVVSANAPGM